MNPIKIVKREAVFIPIKQLPTVLIPHIQEKLTFRFYTEKSCAQCENLIDRFNDICENCAAYVAGYDLASKVKVGANKYLKIPVGSSPTIIDYLESKGIKTNIVDKSPTTKIKPVNFTGTLKPEQEVAVNTLFRKKRGILKAPPRSGKTVMSTALACKVGMKVLIIASQRDWLMGFQETFIGSKTQKPLTDLDPSRIKLCKTLEDFKSHDICLATIQTFYSEKGQAILAKIRDMFPVIFMDEVHTSAADKYIKIVSKLNADYCIGLSGTPSRKDGKFTLVDNIVGPLAHEVRVDSMRPRIQLVKTQYQKEYKGNVPWVRMVSSIENDDKRLKLIADWVIKDVANGHMVLIPMAQVKPIAKLVDIINKKAGYKLAFPFTGSLKKEVRDETIQKAREYKIKVLVGTAKILSTGINIPRASCIFEQVLSSNLENCQQRVARVLTLMEDKPQPVIRIFLDAMNVRKNCLANEYHRVIKPKFKPVISEKDEIALNGYFKAKQQARFEI